MWAAVIHYYMLYMVNRFLRIKTCLFFTMHPETCLFSRPKHHLLYTGSIEAV